MQKRKAVFLDRDGVINRSLVRNGKPFAPTHDSEFEVLPGVLQALDKLRMAGYLNIVVTNQPDVSTGVQSFQTLQTLNAHILKNLAIDAIKVCIHIDADKCNCRKPLPGLILQAAEEFGIDISSSFMVGDRWRDVAAGQQAGCRDIFFLDYGYLELRPTPPFHIVDSLQSAVSQILNIF